MNGENLIGVRGKGREDETAYMRGQCSNYTRQPGEKTYKRGVKEEIKVATNAMMNATTSCK